MGIKLTRDPSRRGEGGYSAGGRINVTDTSKGSRALSTIIHEWTHDLLHHANSKFKDNKLTKRYENKEINLSELKQIREIQAEAVAALVLKYFGFPVDLHTTYMALWQNNGGLNSKELIKENYETIKKIANFIIKEINNRLATNK